MFKKKCGERCCKKKGAKKEKDEKDMRAVGGEAVRGDEKSNNKQTE